MKKILVVGLGNPGNKFIRTRHNIGIDVLRAWVAEKKENHIPVKDWTLSKKVQGEIAEVATESGVVLCLFSQTFMNDSGKSVAAVLAMHALSVDDVIVIHDELELPFGEIALQDTGGARGHNGMRSVFTELDTQSVTRVRIGIGRPPEQWETSDFVLSRFTDEEQKKLETEIVPRATELLSSVITQRLRQE